MTQVSKKLIFLAVLLAGCVLTSVFSSRNEETAAIPLVPQQNISQSAASKQQTKTIRVQVSGAVLEPGIYDLSASSRVEEAVNAAGGFTENADVEKVNLVRKLRDGTQVKVPTLKAGKTGANKKTGRDNSIESGSSRTSASNKAGGAVRTSGSTRSAGARQQAVGSVRINSASAEELQELPGVGPALAQRIISERNKGRFMSADDLVRVPGIGKAKLEKMRSYVVID